MLEFSEDKERIQEQLGMTSDFHFVTKCTDEYYDLFVRLYKLMYYFEWKTRA